MFAMEMGIKVRDKITGFEGVVSGRCQHLTGCDTYGVTPKVDKDGKVQDTHWFDQHRLEVVESKPVMEQVYSRPDPRQADKTEGALVPGGPQDKPQITRSAPLIVAVLSASILILDRAAVMLGQYGTGWGLDLLWWIRR